MARFNPKSPQDLQMFRAGMCPDCGAGIWQGMTACKVCGLTFEAHAHELPPPKQKAAPPVQPQPAQPQQPPQQAYQQPPQQAYQQPPQQAYAQPPSSSAPARAPRSANEARQASLSPIPSPQPIGKPLTADDIDALERGPLRPSDFPHTEAEGPEYIRGDNNPLLGSSLQRAAIVVMADAAIADDPLVLLGHKPVETHVSRAIVDYKRSATADADDPRALLLSRTPTGAPTSSLAQEPSSRSAHAADQALPSGPSFSAPPAERPAVSRPAPDAPVHKNGAVAVPRAAVLASAQNTGKPLSFEEMELIERPVLAVQPHSFAEATDFVAGGNDPRLGAASIKGSNVVMADAAVIDDPLVLLGYPPVVSHIARQAINLKRGDAGLADDVMTLLQRPQPAPSGGARPPTAAPAAPPGGAPATPRTAPQQSTPRAPSAVGAPIGVGRAGDPDATAMLDTSAVRAAAAAVAREEEAARAAHRRPPTAISSRGAVRPLDDK